MRKKIFTISLLCIAVIVCLCMFVGCTKLNENMFPTNGEGKFNYSTIDDLGKDFELFTASSVTDKSTVFSLTENTTSTDDTTYDLTINTTTPGYAYIAKKVKLTGGCYYAIDYSIRIDSTSDFTSGKAYIGVYAAILEDEDLDFAKSGAIKELSSDFENVQFTFRAERSGDATIALKVASEDAPAKITAKVRSFDLKRISRNEAMGSTYIGTYKSDYYGKVVDFNIFYIVMGAFFVVAFGIVGYIMLRRHYAITDPEGGKGYNNNFLLKLEDNGKLCFAAIIGIGLIVRILIDVLSTAIASGYATSKMFLGYNLQGMATQALFIAKYGPQYLLQSAGGAFATDAGYTVSAVSSSPLQLYFLGFCGLLGRIFEKSNAYIATIFFIRFFAAVADILAACVLYDILKKKTGQIGATVVSAMYLCLPVIFAASSLWGYTDSIVAFLLILSVKFLLDNKYIPTAITYFVAFMFSQTALFFAPIIMFYTVFICIKSVKEGEYKNLIAACSILVLSFFVYYALSVPFALNYIQNDKPFYWFGYAWNELYTGAVYTNNAFNFQAILGNNQTQITTASLVVTIIFILFMLTLVGFAYFKFKNRMNLILLATAFINMMFAFANDMSPISMYVSLIMMLMYAIANKEKRVFFSFVVFATLTYINLSYCELMLNYTATTAPVWTGHLPVMYVFSAIEILFSLYYVYIVYDIVVSRKVRKIAPLTLTFADSVKNFFMRIVKKYYKFRIDHKI